MKKTILLLLLFIFGMLLSGVVANNSATISQKDTLNVGLTLSPSFVEENEKSSYGFDGIAVQIFLFANQTENQVINFVKYEGIDNMLDALERGEIDKTASALTFNAERAQKEIDGNISYTSGFFNASIGIATQPVKWYEKLPWKLMLYLLLLIFLLAMVVAYAERATIKASFPGGSISLFEKSVYFVQMILSTTGFGDIAPKTRFGLWFVNFFNFVNILGGISTLIVLFVVLDSNETSIEDVKDLRGEYVGTIASTNSAKFLSTHDVTKLVQYYPSIDAGLQAVVEGRIDYFVYDDPILQSKIASLNIDKYVVILDRKFDPQSYVFAVDKQKFGSEIPQINYSIRKLMESNQYKHILDDFNVEQ